MMTMIMKVMKVLNIKIIIDKEEEEILLTSMGISQETTTIILTIHKMEMT